VLTVWCSVQSPDRIKQRFAKLLVEDTCRGAKSYPDFLCNAHTEIQNKFAQ
jgi:hypothetical protein